MTGEEWREVDKIIKDSVKNGKKSVVRRMLDKSMSYGDALTVLTAFRADTGKNTVDTEKGQEKPVNGAINGNRTEIQGKSNQLERVTDSGIVKDDKIDTVQLTSDIMDLIHNYIVMSGLEDEKDLVKAPQRFWGAVCSYIGDNLIKPIVKPVNTVYANGNRVMDTTIDIPKLADCLKVYCKLCDKYNKAVLIDHAANFAGVSRAYLFNVREKLTPWGLDIWKKREDSIIAGILDGKSGNVTGSAIVLNHDYGYATNQTHTEKKETIVLYPALTSHQENQTPKITTTETKQVL